MTISCDFSRYLAFHSDLIVIYFPTGVVTSFRGHCSAIVVLSSHILRVRTKAVQCSKRAPESGTHSLHFVTFSKQRIEKRVATQYVCMWEKMSSSRRVVPSEQYCQLQNVHKIRDNLQCWPVRHAVDIVRVETPRRVVITGRRSAFHTKMSSTCSMRNESWIYLAAHCNAGSDSSLGLYHSRVFVYRLDSFRTGTTRIIGCERVSFTLFFTEVRRLKCPSH